MKVFAVVFALAGGSFTAAGYFALLTTVAVINRFADTTGTKKHLLLYEEMVIAGAVLGNIIFLFELSANVGFFLPIIFCLASGMFVGTFAVCLAENIKALPIFVRRVRIGTGLGFVILAIALGKAAGNLFYYLLLYK